MLALLNSSLIFSLVLLRACFWISRLSWRSEATSWPCVCSDPAVNIDPPLESHGPKTNETVGHDEAADSQSRMSRNSSTLERLHVDSNRRGWFWPAEEAEMNTAEYGVNSSEDLFASGLYELKCFLSRRLDYNLCICVFIYARLMRLFIVFRLNAS